MKYNEIAKVLAAKGIKPTKENISAIQRLLEKKREGDRHVE